MKIWKLSILHFILSLFFIVNQTIEYDSVIKPKSIF